MPALSPTMTEGTISSFHVSVGDEVTAGDSIATVETDKANMEFEVQEDAFVAWVNNDAVGTKIKLGTVCAVLVDSKDQVSLFENYSPETPATSSSSPAIVQSESQPREEVSSPSIQTEKTVQLSDKIFISPRALKNFTSKGFTKNDVISKLSQISATPSNLGSGPNNRIIEQDVDSLIQKMTQTTQIKSDKPAKVERAQIEPTGTYREVELSTMRRVIADRLSQSKREIPHYYLEAELRMDALLEMKKELQTKANVKLSINDFIVKAVAKASKEVPDCNTNFVDNKIRFFENVDVR